MLVLLVLLLSVAVTGVGRSSLGRGLKLLCMGTCAGRMSGLPEGVGGMPVLAQFRRQ